MPSGRKEVRDYLEWFMEETGLKLSLEKLKNKKSETLTRVYPHMVFIIGGTGKCPSTTWFCTVIWSFSCVCPDMHFSDI